MYDPMEAIQADLLFFNTPEYYTQNSYFKYILVTIDAFSRVAKAVPLKTKSATDVAAALDDIIAEYPITPRKLMVDAGTEFSGSSNAIYNVVVRKYKMVIYILTDSVTKASIAERFNRTLRENFARHFTETGSKRWVEFLPEFLHNYNNREHTAIGMSPNMVSFQNREEVFERLYPNARRKVKCKLKEGWKVRIPVKKGLFEKGSTPNWSSDVYTISKVEQVGRKMCTNICFS